MAKINIYSSDWCDMVFESKNREYGAFTMRNSSSRRHLIALILSVLIFLLATSAPAILKVINPAKKKAKDESVRMLDNIKLDKPKKNEADEVKDNVEPTPPLKTTIRFTPPVIKPDDQVNDEEQIKTQDEVNKTNIAISIADVQGSNEEGAVDIADLQKTSDKQLTDDETHEEPLTIVEQKAEFPGGEEALMQYLHDNLKYPAVAAENDIQGKVILRFIVNKSGTIADVQVLRGIGGGCDEEAVRVVRSMPHWKPAKQNGRSVRYYFILPVVFQLQER
jgi:periplasmic protein TonB